MISGRWWAGERKLYDRIKWGSFYIGDKGFSGPTNLNQMAIYATDINLDTHLYNVHTLKEDPLVNRIKEAANLDSIQV
jgi:hypothetical protein